MFISIFESSPDKLKWLEAGAHLCFLMSKSRYVHFCCDVFAGRHLCRICSLCFYLYLRLTYVLCTDTGSDVYLQILSDQNITKNFAESHS